MSGRQRTWRFESRWALPGPREATYAVLADVEHYPQWWREVRAAVRLTDKQGIVLIRSKIPVTLTLELTARIEDPDAGVLEVAIDGDLIGWSRFTLTSDVRYEQEVRTPRALMNVAPRAVLRANHTAMMRSAERGLAERVRASAAP